MGRQYTGLKFAMAALTASILLVCAKSLEHVRADPKGRAMLSKAVTLKSNQMAEFAYQTGCYEGFVKACGRIDDDEVRGGCFREGLRNCGGHAKAFREWIEDGR